MFRVWLSIEIIGMDRFWRCWGERIWWRMDMKGKGDGGEFIIGGMLRLGV